MTENNEAPEPAKKPESETPVEEVIAEEPVVVQEEKPSEELSKDARMWAMICHLAGLAGLVVPVVGCIVGPLVIWQIKKDEFPFVDEQGKEALNFQISMLIYAVIAGLLIFACIGSVLLPAVAIFDLIFLLIAAVKTNNGGHYRYPLTIRFIK